MWFTIKGYFHQIAAKFYYFLEKYMDTSITPLTLKITNNYKYDL